MFDVLVGELKDGSFLEKRRFLIGNDHHYLLLFLRLDAEDIFVVDLIIQSREVRLGQVVVELQVLNLLLGGVGEVENEFQTMVGD